MSVFCTDLPMVGRVTRDSAQVTLTTSSDNSDVTKIQVIYSTDSDLSNSQTSAVSDTSTANEYSRLIVTITGLNTSTLYYYKCQYSIDDEVTWADWGELEENGGICQFRTARAAGEAFSVGLWADSHLMQAVVSLATPPAKNDEDWHLARLQSFIATLQTHLPDLFFNMGDENFGPNAYVTTQDECHEVDAVIRNFWKALLNKRAFCWVLGNHEASGGSYMVKSTTRYHQRWHTIADKRFFLNSLNNSEEVDADWQGGIATTDERIWGADNSGYTDGDCISLENYYNVVWGDAEFFVIDPYRYTRIGQTSITDGSQYTLGPAQLAWLKAALAASTAKWKIVVSHQIVGGSLSSDGYRCGVGAILSAGNYMVDTGDGTGLHDILESYGVHLYLYAHDHFFHYGKCRETDRLIYVQGGTPGWRLNASMEANGYLPQYVTEHRYGYLRLDFAGEILTVRYVLTDTSLEPAYMEDNNPLTDNPTYNDEFSVFTITLPTVVPLTPTSTPIFYKFLGCDYYDQMANAIVNYTSYGANLTNQNRPNLTENCQSNICQVINTKESSIDSVVFNEEGTIITTTKGSRIDAEVTSIEENNTGANIIVETDTIKTFRGANVVGSSSYFKTSRGANVTGKNYY